MPILETVSVITTVGNSVYQTLTSILPGLRGKTQHLSYQQASDSAIQYATQLADSVKRVYGSSATNGAIANRLYALTLDWITRSGRWAGNDKTNTALGYLRDNPGYAGVISPGSEDYFKGIIYIHAWWVLYNMDVDNPDEFTRDMAYDLQNATLVPAISQAGYDPKRLQVSPTGSVGSPSVSPLQAGMSLQIIIVVVIIGITVALSKH